MKKINILLYFVLFVVIGNAQKPNWQNLDLKKDSVFGISTEKAYSEILVHKKEFTPVVVGVIDSGVDTSHEDLKTVIWTNPNEIPGNGIDDEKDGYIDDVHGWNFIGGPHGNIKQENLELVRLIRAGKGDSAMMREYTKQLNTDHQIVENVTAYMKILDAIVSKINKDTPTVADFRAYQPSNPTEEKVRNKMIEIFGYNPDYTAYHDHLAEYQKHFQDELEYSLNMNFNPRPVVGDDTLNLRERYYGNNDVTGPGALHGTHVSGIIAAVRNNDTGIQGIADHAWILSIRTVPEGDERDKDVANAIRYAADHGAKVVNMSFGKAYSPDKKIVDEAVKYAMGKDVLLVHAVGNEGKNLDHERNFPSRVYADGSGMADAWIEVGASGWDNDSTLVAGFSNYGKTSVDVFAPGEKLLSSVPGSKYRVESGTSMASPVVAGLAALIREYFPKLTAVEVKEVIMHSVVKPLQNIIARDGSQRLSVPFSEICISGGIVNAYQALLLAEKINAKK
ncbi:MAG: S8 family peptidase [Bacteroidota bacterium]|nr:S8 family peptidase [Bacteroidota bacterium]